MTHEIDITQRSILLAEQLWDSVRQPAEAVPLTDTQKQELDRRWAALERGEMATSTWPEVKKRLLGQWQARNH
jgi:putative addiction module component (TIGR02574 family)